MKHLLRIACGLLLATSLHAAEPAINDAEPAVDTSRPQQEPATGRGNPRRPEVAVGTAPAASTEQPATAPPAAQSAAPAAGQARRSNTDRIELGTTQITGNAELPRVMYVVPWKRAELGDLAGKPAKSLLDEVLAPVDRDVFRRQNRYYEALKPDAAPKDP
jgi:hypothetical protein